ncbi:unnamed protein product [Cuscuta campestris]|uniref:Uncharacterized protein n=1 Tax=Cuscuta campestris TaxID=132261 RepID=A0A484KQQ9_9ASTE|nr:unnamed protein product [Cuscuta campestris]
MLPSMLRVASAIGSQSMRFTEEELESIVNSNRSICSILLLTVHHLPYCSSFCFGRCGTSLKQGRCHRYTC